MDTNQAANKTNSATAESQLLQSSLLMMGHGDHEPKGPPALSETPTLSGLLQAAKRRWPLAMGAALIASVITVVAVFVLLPPKFNVTMRTNIAKQPGIDESNHAIFTANMEARMKSWSVLNAALNEKTGDGREIKDLDLVRSKGMGAVDWLEKALKTDYKLGPEVLRVTLAADSAEEAAELLNAIARAFMAEYAEIERSKKQARLVELRRQKELLEGELRSLRNLHKQQLETLEIKDREAATVQQQEWLRRLAVADGIKRSNEEELIKAQNEIIAAKARLQNLDKQEVPDDVLYEWFSKDLGIQGLMKRLAEIEDEINRIYREYNEPLASQKAVPHKHAKIETREKIEQREAQIKPSIEKVWRGIVRKELNTQMNIAELRSQDYQRNRDRLHKEVLDLEKKVKESGAGQLKPQLIQATEDKIELAKLALNQTSQKISEVDLEVPGSRISISQKATVPNERDSSQQIKVAGAGGFAMFFLALFGVAFFEFRARKIGAAQEVAHGLGMKVIGTVPAMPARSRNPSGPDSAVGQMWQHQLQESMDAIRTVILHQARSEALHVLLITSASSGEGKTTLATQLAASLARAWKRTLIIDGDLRHPATHTLFNVTQEPGLAEVLRGEVEPGDAIKATPFSRLWVLPAGNGDAHAIQALAQDNVRTLFEQLKQQYDFIIIDAPPVLPVTDSLLLGQHVDSVLFAILRDVSRAPAIHAAQQKMAPLGVPSLGAVVLGTDAEFTEKNYGFALSAAATS